MSRPDVRPRPRSHAVPALLALMAVMGVALGWALPAGYRLGFDHFYALLAPFFTAIVCLRALAGASSQHRWLVPLFLGLAILSVATRPHVPSLSGLSLVAAVVATLAGLRDRKPVASLAVLVACAALSASLLLSGPG